MSVTQTFPYLPPPLFFPLASFCKFIGTELRIQCERDSRLGGGVLRLLDRLFRSFAGS